MSIETSQITVSGLQVSIVRKAIKNLHLGVYPPRGRVRVAAPLAVSDAAVRLAVVGKLGWIKRQQARFASQPRQSKREMVSGESHYFLGRRYRLRVVPHDGPPKVARRRSTIELHVRHGSSAEQRQRVLHRSKPPSQAYGCKTTFRQPSSRLSNSA
jgi:predicted metal-dependent hydrolase